MTNYEYYKDEIRHMAKNRCSGFAVEKETYKLHPCALFPCDKCLFNSNKERISCNFLMLDWANQTYKETLYKELFSDIPDAESSFLTIIYSGYIARDFDGTLRYFENHPQWIHNYWFDENDNIIINREYFDFIKTGECYLFCEKRSDSNRIKIINMTGELRP